MSLLCSKYVWSIIWRAECFLYSSLTAGRDVTYARSSMLAGKKAGLLNDNMALELNKENLIKKKPTLLLFHKTVNL